MPYDWVEPAVFMRHGPHAIYHVYKDDRFQSGSLLFHYSISPLGHIEGGEETGVFDARKLPLYQTYIRSGHDQPRPPQPVPTLEDTIRDTLDSGYFQEWYLENEELFYSEVIAKRTKRAKEDDSKHNTKFVQAIQVIDPDTGLECEMEIRKDLSNLLLIGIDGFYLSQDIGPVLCPYEPGVELIISEDEEGTNGGEDHHD